MMRNLILLPLLCLALVAQAQYSEIFSVAGKGYKTNCVNDLTTVNWTMTPWDPTGSCQNDPPDPVTDLRDPSDYFNTTAGGVMESIDTDQEVCWESPLINTVAAPTVSIEMDLTWAGFDVDVAAGGCLGDYIKVMYSVNGGAYTMVPNVKGGNPCATVAYLFSGPPGPHTDNVHINQGGIAGGSTLKIRVCVYTTANAEIVTIDNISVPQAGVTVGCAAPTLSTVVSQVGCSNPNSGAIDLNVSGGTPGYTYSWTGGVTTQDLSNKPTGTYTVTVTDAASCSATISATITAAPAISLITQVLDASCSGNFDGEISLDVSGGVPGYTYDWSNDGPENPDNDPQDLVNLGTGTYTVTVTDATGCSSTKSATIGVLPSGAYLEQFNIANKGYLPNFVDDFSGVAWTMSGWLPQPPALFGRDVDDFFRTSGGVLVGEDFDQEICWTSPLIDLNGGTQFSLNLSWTGFDVQVEEYINVKYSIDGGSYITLPNIVGGGAGTIQYTSGTDQSGATVVTKTGLSGGTIQIQVCGNFNSNGESMTLDNVSIPGSNNYCPAPEPSLTPTNVTCNGAANGTITTTVVNGSAPFTYAWSDGGITTQNRTGLGPGTYTVTVTDANMMTGTASTMITQPPAIVLSTTQVNVLCNGASTGSIDLTATGGVPGLTYNWGGGITTQDRSGLAAGTYTVTVTDANNCTKTISATITQPAALLLTAVLTHPTNCFVADGQINLSVSNGLSPYTYDWSNDGPENPDNDTEDLLNAVEGTYTVTVTDANSCTKTSSFTLDYVDIVPPAITCPANATVNANASCQGTVGSYSAASLSDNCNLSPTVTQSPASSTLLTGHNSTQLVTLTANDGNGNTSTCTLTVTLKDVTPPSLTCPANATVSANASCQGTVGTYSASSLSDNCNPSPTVTQSPASSTLLTGHNSTQLVTLTANDGNGNTSTCTLTVTLKDVTPPSITCPANATVNVNASCQGMVGSYSATNLSDNCNPSPTVTQSPVSPTVLTGHNSTQLVTLTANDGNGNTGTCTLTVTLKDVTPPSLSCPANATVNANASCQGTVGTYLASSLSDNCNPSPTVTQSPASSTVLTGHNSTQLVTLTANDGNGNTSTCTLTVTLKDVTPPSLTCPVNATINANASCQGTLGTYSASSLSDNCNPSPTVTQSPVSSTVLTGHNSTQLVTLTANDGNGNTSTCTLTVTLKDVTPPSLSCPANATVNANASCQGTVGSYVATSLSDNCNPTPVVTQSPASSTVMTGHNSTQLVTLTANDGNGNTSTCTLTVTLKDVTPPSLTCPANVTVNANASCQGTVGTYSASSLSDNCNPSPAVTQSPVSSTVLTGHNSTQLVTLTANDGNGNTSTCTLTVTLKDVTPPSITCPANVNINANASCAGTVGAYSPVSLSDNCNPSPTVTQSPSASTALNGHNDFEVVTITANDGNGNTQFCTFTVTLKDVTPPNITCPGNITLNANASCSATIGSYLPTTLIDNCNPTPTASQSPAAGTVLSGANSVLTVFLTGSDGNGNTQNCTFTVTLKDITPPSVVCKPFTANLGPTGAVSIVPANVFQSGADNCGTVNLQSVTPNSFTCSNIGANQVILTVNDGNGNTSACSAIVTVADVTVPVAKCKDITANLGTNGTVTVAPSLVNNGTTDNCSFTLTLTPNTFNCSNVGIINTVVLRATDAGGNSATCTAKVTVKDLVAPLAKCKNPTIFLDALGQATLSVNQVNNGSTDACGIATMSINDTQFNCSELAGSPWPVTLSLSDVNGNTSSCLAYVTVKDAIAPTAVCENVTVALGQNGYAAVYCADLTPNSTDNCAVWSCSPNAKVYTAANLGNNNLTVTVKDYSNNGSTCVSVVTVVPYGTNNNFQQGGGGKGHELMGSHDLLLFPNPTSGDAEMAFQLPADQSFVCRIFDTSGRLVYSHEDRGVQGENRMALRLEGLAPGLYVLDFQSEDWKVQKRLVVQE